MCYIIFITYNYISFLDPDRDVFKTIQTICFLEIFTNIFQVFKKTVEYSKWISSNRNANSVSLDDFLYYGQLGEGGFGTVGIL